MLISILTPSYNSAKYVQRAIDSVKTQSYTNWEHIIVDGASTDGTIEILKKEEHLKWVSEPDSGQSDAMNKAFRMSKGDIIVYLNADDYFHKDTFSAIINVFHEKATCNFIIGNLERIKVDNQTNKVLEHDIISPAHTYKDIFQTYKRKHFPYNPVCYFYKREVQIQVGDFQVNNHYSMDLFFLLRALQICTSYKIDKVLGTFWTDGNNKTSTTNCININYQTIMQHCNKYNKMGALKFHIGKFVYSNIRPLWINTKVLFYPLYKLVTGKS